MLRAPSGPEAVRAVCSVVARLSKRTDELVTNGQLPLVLGGDHSCAIGVWRGVARALAPRGPLGLIWIDAHIDAHTPETTPSGMLHGMPVACLLGHGDPRLAAAGIEVLDPRRVCLVGVRSFEDGEAALLARLGVKVIHMQEVRRRGLAAVMAEALAIARGGTAGYGVSLDLDALDPQDAPGVSIAVPGGIRAADLRQALARFAHDPCFVALEIVEYNPHRDRDGVTERVVGDVVASLLGLARFELHTISATGRRMNSARVRSIRSGSARAPGSSSGACRRAVRR